MDLKASQCVMAAEAAAYTDMAETWRQLAHEAAWHNACSGSNQAERDSAL
jgi:hypothetical protein